VVTKFILPNFGEFFIKVAWHQNRKYSIYLVRGWEGEPTGLGKGNHISLVR
jgi:hypothetical protein